LSFESRWIATENVVLVQYRFDIGNGLFLDYFQLLGIMDCVNLYGVNALPMSIVYADGTCKINSVLNLAFSGIVGRKGELYKFILVCGSVSEFPQQSFYVGSTSFNVFLWIKQILYFVAVCGSGHHLHQS